MGELNISDEPSLRESPTPKRSNRFSSLHLCRHGRGVWCPRYYKGQDGRSHKFHPFWRFGAHPPPQQYATLAGIRRRQMRERIEARSRKHRPFGAIGYYPGLAGFVARLRTAYPDNRKDGAS